MIIYWHFPKKNSFIIRAIAFYKVLKWLVFFEFPNDFPRDLYTEIPDTKGKLLSELHDIFPKTTDIQNFKPTKIGRIQQD